MDQKKVSIRYPRRVVLRFFLRLIGRFLLLVLTRTTVTGRENFPKKGPVILVGNHVAVIEVVLMAMYAPWSVEIIGTGDIPIDPRYAWMVRLWGILPVRRGSVDRNEMRMPMDVLDQNGAVGIFPEGGIWETSLKKARTGVAWLSYRTNAPVLPIGFGGMKGALQAAFQFRRPKLVMNVGKLLPPVNPTGIPGMSRKEALQESANEIMNHVAALIPEDEKRDWRKVEDEHFDFKYVLHYLNDTGDIIDQEEHTVTYPEALGKFFHRPVILDVMARNMRLPVRPLQRLAVEHDAQKLTNALDVTLKFLNENPHFLSYRFGYEEAEAMNQGVTELREITQAAAQAGQQISLRPIRRYHSPDQTDEVIEEVPATMHEM